MTVLTRARGLAFRLLGDGVAAEDVAAEAMARAYGRWSRVGELPYRTEDVRAPVHWDRGRAGSHRPRRQTGSAGPEMSTDCD